MNIEQVRTYFTQTYRSSMANGSLRIMNGAQAICNVHKPIYVSIYTYLPKNTFIKWARGTFHTPNKGWVMT